MSHSFEFVVIGSGPAGQKAAVQAAKAGKKVALIEGHSEVGGACLHYGTLPSKSIRESIYRFSLSTSGNLRHDIDHSTVPEISALPDWARILRRRKRVIAAECEVVTHQLARNKIQLFTGWAKFISPHEVEVRASDGSTQIIRGDRFLIAAGANPCAPKMFNIDGKVVHDSNTILSLTKTPKSLVVLGAGVIGCEYASMFLMAGTQVTLVDKNDQILATIDREIVEHLVERFQHFHMRTLLKRDTEKIEVATAPSGEKFARVILKDGQVLEAEMVLIAMGRQGNTANLGLEKAGVVANERGIISVNKQYQTATSHIYAAGDIVGFPALASTSMEQGRIAACHAFGIENMAASSLPENYPYGIYTIPEISTVGHSEQELQEQGVDFVIGRAFYREVARGLIVGDRWGLLKMLIDRKTHKILGVHIVGDSAAEIVHIGQSVMTLGGDVWYFVHNVFNYPTFAEAYKTAALYAINRLKK